MQVISVRSRRVGRAAGSTRSAALMRFCRRRWAKPSTTSSEVSKPRKITFHPTRGYVRDLFSYRAFDSARSRLVEPLVTGGGVVWHDISIYCAIIRCALALRRAEAHPSWLTARNARRSSAEKAERPVNGSNVDNKHFVTTREDRKEDVCDRTNKEPRTDVVWVHKVNLSIFSINEMKMLRIVSLNYF